MGAQFQQDSGDDFGGGMLSEINVTPLVDVMLVLLIIFMVTAPLLQQGMSVNLPQARTEAMPGDETTLVVSVTAEGQLFMMKNEVTLDELGVKLGAIAKTNPDKEIFLKADAEVPHGKVVAVMATIQQAGLTRLGVVTQPGDVEDL